MPQFPTVFVQVHLFFLDINASQVIMCLWPISHASEFFYRDVLLITLLSYSKRSYLARSFNLCLYLKCVSCSQNIAESCFFIHVEKSLVFYTVSSTFLHSM